MVFRLVLLLCFCAGSLQASVSQETPVRLQVGRLAPSFSAKLVSDVPSLYKLDCSRYKITVIEFWATWCSPCIKEIPRLNALHKKYKSQVQIIGIADDSEKRLQQFESKISIDYPLISDANRAVAGLYPHQMLPYTVVLDHQQRVIAITTPDQLTEQVIADLLQGRKVALTSSEVTANKQGVSQPVIDGTTKPTVVFKPQVPGASFAQPGKGEYRGRRWTYVNMTIDHMYRHTYGLTSNRLIYSANKREFDPMDSKHLYYFDIVVPESKKALLFETVRLELDKVQPVRCRLEKRRLAVYVLKRKSAAVTFTKAGGVGNGLVFSGSSFHNKGVTFKDFSYFLENTLADLKPWLPLPVVDETGLMGYYNIDFAFQFENPASLGQELDKLGLILEKTERETECLYIINSKQ